MRRLRKRLARSAMLLEPLARLRGWTVLPERAQGSKRRHALHRAGKSDAPRPLVLACHGRDGTPFEFVFTSLPRLAARRGWDVLCPDLRGATPDDPEREQEVLALVAKHAPGPSARVYALGFSLGGAVAVRLALRHPEVFAAAASIAGAELDDVPSAAPEVPKAPFPVFASHGAEDPITPPAASERLVRQLEQRGHRCALEIVPELGHDLAVLDRVLPRLFDFFAR